MKAGSAPLWSVCVVALIATSFEALAQTADEMNAANNPLQPALGVNLQNIYIDSYYGLDDADSNSALLRGVLPHKLFGKPQLLRATLPIVTTPDLSPTGQKTGVSDLNIFDIVLTQSGGFELGIGPQLTLPTAGRDETGTGIGKVWKLSAATCNFFVEPQWTVAHDGDGVPKFQIYAGLNLQFPL